MLSWFYNIADEPLEITYSYWDGAGHRRIIQASLTLLIIDDLFQGVLLSCVKLTIRFAKVTLLENFSELFSSNLHQSFERFEQHQWRTFFM